MKRRGPTIRACIKRLQSISLSELRELTTRDLNNLKSLPMIMGPVEMVLAQRNESKISITPNKGKPDVSEYTPIEARY